MIEGVFSFLNNAKSPRVIAEAMKLYGTKEIVGAKHNNVILNWAKELDRYVGIPYNADEIPWCGLFVGVCVLRAKFKPVNICVRASEWAKFGNPADKPSLGDILVFSRKGGGHVGFYVGENSTHYQVLGGNQGNMVNIMALSKSRLTAVRRCPWRIMQPRAVKPVIVSDIAGIEVSRNEA